MKILTIIGARPQFIKAATVSRVVAELDNVTEVIVHTGQHFDTNMSDVFFEEMGIPKPDYQLNIASLSHGAMTGRMLEEIEKLIQKETPDWVLVYGDTNSTLAGALAASKLHIKVAHVEAGLRSFNMQMPEEQNRILTDRLSSILFCPTETALANLEKEGYKATETKMLNIGDVMLDAAKFYRAKAKKPTHLSESITQSFVLATIHRAENTDNIEKLTNIVNALNKLHSYIPVVLPLHPRTRNILAKAKLTLDVKIIEPVGYLEMIYLLERCKFITSDSGGVQKEAYFFNKHCLIIREETEWTELVDVGANIIVGTDTTKILDESLKILRSEEISSTFGQNFYGNADAAESILNELMNY